MEEIPTNSRNKFHGVKTEKRRSINLNMVTGGPVSVRPKRNFMSLRSDELEDREIFGTRK